MSKPSEKKHAIALRRKGFSIKDIAEKVGVSRGSVSVWVRDISLSGKQRARLKQKMIDGGHAGRLAGAAWNKQQRLIRLAKHKENALQKIKKVSTQDLFFLGLGLYWGEGFKSEKASAGFSNSDPRVINVMVVWLEQCMNIPRDRLRMQIFISDTHRGRAQVIERYWLEVTGLPKSQCAKIIFLPKTKKFYENKDSYYGVCTIRILKGTEIRDRINSLIQRTFDVHGQYRR